MQVSQTQLFWRSDQGVDLPQKGKGLVYAGHGFCCFMFFFFCILVITFGGRMRKRGIQ